MSMLGDLIKYENVPQGIPPRLATNSAGAVTGLRAPDGRVVHEFNNPAAKRNFFKKRAITVDNMDNALVTWETTGVTTKALAPEMARKDFNCATTLKLSGFTSFATASRYGLSVKFTGTIDVWVHLNTDPTNTMYLTVQVSKDAFATTNIGWAVTQALFLHSGWNKISLNIAEDGTTYQPGGAAPTTVGTISFADTMNAFRFFIGNAEGLSPDSGLPLEITIGGIFYGGESQANVILNWDDAFAEQWDIFNIFRARGLTGSMAIIPSIINFGGITLDQLHEMYDWGWDIVNHTMQSTAGNLLADSEAEVRRKIGVARDWMLSHGFSRTANVLVWPENAYNARIINIAREYGIVLARGARNTNLRTFQAIDNPMCVGSFGMGGKTLAQTKKALDAAELYKCTTIICGHRMSGTATSPASGGTPPADSLYWNQSDFISLADDICDRVAAGTIANINYYQLIQECRI